MLTMDQVRAGRGLLDWTQGDLANASGLSQAAIARYEKEGTSSTVGTVEKIIAAFDKADVELIGDTGVKKRTNEVQKFRGKSGLIAFMDDVYECAQNIGGKMYFYNIVPENWSQTLGDAWWSAHVERMMQYNEQTDIKILVPEGNENFISAGYAQYKWFPKNFELSGKKSLYSYGNKLGFVAFGETDDMIEILTLQSSSFAEGVRALFEVAWDNVGIMPKKIK